MAQACPVAAGARESARLGEHAMARLQVAQPAPDVVQLEPQVDRLAPRVVARREAAHHLQRPLEVGRALPVGEAGERHLAGAAEPARGALPGTRVAVVRGEREGVVVEVGAVHPLDRLADATVERGAPGAGQALVRHVPDARVAEVELAVGLVQHVPTHELLHHGGRGVVVQPGGGDEQAKVERAADDGRRPGRLGRTRRERVEPRRDEPLDPPRQGHARARARLERARRLHRHQRVAGADLPHAVGELRRPLRRQSAAERLHEPADGGAIERPRRELPGTILALERGQELAQHASVAEYLGPQRHHEADVLRSPPDQVGQQLQARLVRPVHVVERDQEGSRARDGRTGSAAPRRARTDRRARRPAGRRARGRHAKARRASRRRAPRPRRGARARRTRAPRPPTGRGAAIPRTRSSSRRSSGRRGTPLGPAASPSARSCRCRLRRPRSTRTRGPASRARPTSSPAPRRVPRATAPRGRPRARPPAPRMSGSRGTRPSSPLRARWRARARAR